MRLTLPLLLLLAAPCLAQAGPTPADVKAVAAGDAAFACDLYRALREQPGNLACSPYSVAQALGLAYTGAKGATAAELAQVLHAELPAERWHPARQRLAEALAARGKNKRARNGQPFRLSVADRAWGQQGYPFRPDYLQRLERWYGAGLEQVDFAGDVEGARERINAWISERTDERIPELLQPRDLQPSNRLVLTNAVYFNAGWQSPFEASATHEATFHGVDGDARVPFMAQSGHLRRVVGEGYQAVELGYEGYEVAMLVVVPDAGTFAEFEAGFDAARLQALLGAEGQWGQVDLRLPRWETRTHLGLRDALEALGMTISFLPGQADFSGMDGTRELFVGNVIHETWIDVDEAGTEAAAATAVVMDAGGMPEEPTLMQVDRPFLYLIYDLETKGVVFLGRVVGLSPAAE